MRVLLVNGSPRQNGCTYAALCEVASALESEGVKADHFWIGSDPLTGCTACWACMKNGRCRYDDTVNQFLDLAPQYDGFVFGSPVHFGAAAGSMSGFMSRAFFIDKFTQQHIFEFKPGAAVVSARRAGTTATLDQLNKFMTNMQMPVVSSRYWNAVHGMKPSDVQKDEEGLQIMRALGRNMAWLLKCIEAGKQAGVEKPEEEQWISTNFIND